MRSCDMKAFSGFQAKNRLSPLKQVFGSKDHQIFKMNTLHAETNAHLLSCAEVVFVQTQHEDLLFCDACKHFLPIGFQKQSKQSNGHLFDKEQNTQQCSVVFFHGSQRAMENKRKGQAKDQSHLPLLLKVHQSAK